MKRFDALVIDPSFRARSALKELLHNEQQFGQLAYRQVQLFNSPIDAIAELSAGTEVDVVFISDRIPAEQINRFIRAAKEIENDRGISYIVTLDRTAEVQPAMSEGLAFGSDGFLMLPCSIDNLRDITTIAHRIKSETHERLLKVALTMMVETLVDEIEYRVIKLFFYDQRMGYGRALRGAVQRLLGENPQHFPLYVEILEAALNKMKPIECYLYKGPSARVRRMYENAAKN